MLNALSLTALKGILEIKYAPIEILIINDGSTDKSVDLLKNLFPTTRI